MKTLLTKQNYSCNLALLLFILSLNLNVNAQTTKAFPTALGGGAYSRSNQPYELYEVTNLNPGGEGSFWNGITQSNKIIVFKVGGIISLNEDYQTSYSNTNSNLIILGQTAPYPGITIVSNGLKFVDGNNLIIRYVKFRHWRGRDVLHEPNSADVIDALNYSNIIYDHCSFAFGGDESVSTRFASHNFTLQNSIVSYALSGGLFGDSADYTLGYDYSSIGNLWHTVGKRTPNPNGNGRFDIINNVTYNVLNLAMRTGGDVRLNEIGNYYRYTLRSHLAVTQNPIIYTANNRSNQYNLTANNQDNKVIWQTRPGDRDLIDSDFTSTMYPLMNYDIPLLDGDGAYLRVTNREIGANKYLDNNGNAATYIDDLDTEAYDEFDNDTRFSWTDPDGLVSSNPNNRSQVNYRVIPQRQWLPDNEPNFGVIVNEHLQTTHTGVVPNTWIIAQGLTPSTFNPLGYDLSSEYTNIEVYSFGVDFFSIIEGTSVEISPNSETINIPETIDLEAVFNPINTTDQSGVWESSDDSIATVNNNGLVTPVSSGEVTITFTSNQGGFTDDATIIVTNIVYDLESVSVTPETTTLDVDETIQLELEFNPSNATDTSGTWSTNNEEIAQVDSNGIVTALNEGEAIITFIANDGGFSVSSTITVINTFFGTYELYNAISDDLIQNIDGDTDVFLGQGENQINFRSIPQGGDTNPQVESVGVTWDGVDSGSHLENSAIYAGMVTHSGFDFLPYAVVQGTYNFTVTYYDANEGGGNVVAEDNFSLTFIFDNDPVVNAGNDQSICIGESATLTAIGGPNLLWNTDESTATIVVTPNTTTTYSVIAFNSNGEEATDEVTVFVDTPPVVTVSSDVTILESESTTLTANGATDYLWSTGETTSAITVSPTQTTTYTVTGINGTCEAQEQIIVTVEELFLASAGDDERVCENDDYEIELTANTGDSYLWSTGETTQSIIVSPLSTENYTVTVTSGDQESTDDVTVFVDPNPNVVIANGDSVDILNGDFITISASGANTYEWNNGATQPNIAVSPSQTTTYEVRGFINDCYDEKDIVVNVFEPVVAYAGEDILICIDDSVVLTATGGDEYLWSTGEVTPSIEVAPTETTDYSVTVFNAVDFDEAVVTVEVDVNCFIEPTDPVSENISFGMDMYPNPASSIVNIKLSGTFESSEIKLYDLTGKLIMATEVPNQNYQPTVNTQINVSALESGVYFVTLKDDGGQITKRLVVR